MECGNSRDASVTQKQTRCPHEQRPTVRAHLIIADVSKSPDLSEEGAPANAIWDSRLADFVCAGMGCAPGG